MLPALNLAQPLRGGRQGNGSSARRSINERACNQTDARTAQPTRAHVAIRSPPSHFASMKARKHPRRRTTAGALSLPIMIGDMTLSSLETIARRTWMMAQGRCSAAEYRRMVLEKARAARCSASALAHSRGKDTALAVLAPWHSRAKANARRLRKR